MLGTNIRFAVPPKLTSEEIHFITYNHMCQMCNEFGSRQLLLLVRAALKRPFNNFLYIAISPPATLLDIKRLFTILSQRFSCLIALTIHLQFSFVKAYLYYYFRSIVSSSIISTSLPISGLLI